VKFTNKGIISIGVTKNEKQLEITIKDTGSGIPGYIMPKLFSKFVSSSENGTGLGLFISRKIMEAHGGIIWAENGEVNGAIFKIRLPLN
jgi:two-component system, OmpR family, sensor histidine kinase VicK